jgi:putative endonuclease
MNKFKQQYYCYLLANQKYGTLYVGVTSDLLKRMDQHKNGLIDGFTTKYRINKLVWFESYNDAETAILREKQIKKWNRNWKLRLIDDANPNWDDLHIELIDISFGMDSRLRGNDNALTEVITQ